MTFFESPVPVNILPQVGPVARLIVALYARVDSSISLLALSTPKVSDVKPGPLVSALRAVDRVGLSPVYDIHLLGSIGLVEGGKLITDDFIFSFYSGVCYFYVVEFFLKCFV